MPSKRYDVVVTGIAGVASKEGILEAITQHTNLPPEAVLFHFEEAVDEADSTILSGVPKAQADRCVSDLETVGCEACVKLHAEADATVSPDADYNVDPARPEMDPLLRAIQNDAIIADNTNAADHQAALPVEWLGTGLDASEHG